MDREIRVYIGCFLIFFGGMLFLMVNIYQGFQESGCNIGKLKMLNYYMEDVNRMGEYRLLCPNEECVEQFGLRINNSLERIHEVLEIECGGTK